jgi:hypothetical protein
MSPTIDDDRDCVRCGTAPAVDALGYCGHCHWVVRAEIEDGLHGLRQYLTKWARFDEWCSTHDAAA